MTRFLRRLFGIRPRFGQRVIKNIKYGPVAMPGLDKKIKAARRVA